MGESKATTTRGFWDRINKPIYALAPMADVTDAAYRRLIARLGKPDVMFTEFVSADGLCSDGRPYLLKDLWYTEAERPIVAQIFSAKPEVIQETASLMADLNFDGIDINMGCPDKNVCKQGAGAALIKTPRLAQEIVVAAQEGARGLPVSVKTRIGFTKAITAEWVGHLLETKPAAVTLHFRTRREMSKVDAHWELAHEAVQAARGSSTLMLGNGDVRDLDHADQLVAQTGLDGIMLGRAIFGNPWLFDRSRRPEDIDLDERLGIIAEHARLFEEIFGSQKNFAIMRRYLKAYFAGLRGARKVRIMLDSIKCANDVEELLAKIRETLLHGTLNTP